MEPSHLNCESCVKIACTDSGHCETVACAECSVRLHACKLEDHRTLCSRALVQCLNFNYGCDAMLLRFKQAEHLARCPASVVVCSFEWNRRALSEEERRRMKRRGRAKAHGNVSHREATEQEMDLAMALSDQAVVERSLRFSRSQLVGRRSQRYPRHPLLPLVDVFDRDGNHQTGDLQTRPEAEKCPTDAEDSSDEERERKEKARRAKTAMFKGCLMCQIDPSSQHLHTLGNTQAQEGLRIKMKRIRPSAAIGPFHSDVGLHMELHHSMDNPAGNGRLDEQCALYSFRCLHAVPRREFSRHYSFAHLDTADRLHDIVLRCPLWRLGCRFTTTRHQPVDGFIRFVRSPPSFVHCTERVHESYAKSAGPELLDQPLWALEAIFQYLPSHSIHQLAITCRQLREKIGVVFGERFVMTEVLWKKTKLNGWVEDGFQYRICGVDAPPHCEWRVRTEGNAELSAHLSVCPFYVRVNTEEECSLFVSHKSSVLAVPPELHDLLLSKTPILHHPRDYAVVDILSDSA